MYFAWQLIHGVKKRTALMTSPEESNVTMTIIEQDDALIEE